ncbi:MAG: hypothetical protein LWW94_02575 [Candidatus Desulfofervidaceae bacterium]|nr:hypothetical protein [Candidatus Desulfofervidaceae bacterium]
MSKAYRLKIFILIIFGFIFLLNNLSAAAVLVEGDLDLLVPLAEYTHCLDNSPAIFFSEQIGEKGLALINFVDEIIITDSPQGLILDFLKKKYRVQFGNKKYGKYETLVDGWHEIWVRSPKVLSKLYVAVDGQKCTKSMEKIKKRWAKIGELYLKAGVHKVTTENSEQIVIVPKKTMKRCINLLITAIERRARLNYLFWGEKLKKPLQLEVLKDESFAVKSVFLYNNFAPSKAYPFGLYFVLLDSARKPGQIFRFVESNGINCKYNQHINENGLNVTTHFYEPEKIREAVRVRYSAKKEIDLTEWPALILTYKIENPEVQKMELICWVKLEDEYTENPNPPEPIIVPVDNIAFASRGFISFYVNLYQKIKEIFHTTEAYLTRVDILLEKKDGVDCSDRLKGEYRFIVHHLRLAKAMPYRVSINDQKWLWSGYYYNDEEGELKSVKFLYQVPPEEKVIYKPEIEQVDLAEVVNKTVDFLISDPNKGSIKEYVITYYLDFDGDGKVDGEITKSTLSFGPNLEVSLPTYQEVKEKYSYKSKYRLLKIEIKETNEKIKWQYLPLVLKIKRFVRQPSHLAQSFPILAIDGHVLKAITLSKEQTNDGNVYVNFGILNLREGEHHLNINIPKDEKWKAKAILIESLSSEGENE